MITGGHVVIYSQNAEADRLFLRDVLGFDHVDAGSGWLIFALPPSEVAVHPSEEANHELYLMCDDLDATMTELSGKGVALWPITEVRWGRTTRLTLPGGGQVGLYEPRHARPPHTSA